MNILNHNNRRENLSAAPVYLLRKLLLVTALSCGGNGWTFLENDTTD